MATYKATEAVYVDEVYVRPGERFTTNAPKGKTWEAIDALDHDGDGRKGGARKRPASED